MFTCFFHFPYYFLTIIFVISLGTIRKSFHKSMNIFVALASALSMQWNVWSKFFQIFRLSCLFCSLAAALWILLASKRAGRISAVSRCLAAVFQLLLASKRACRISAVSSCLAAAFLTLLASKRACRISAVSRCLAAVFQLLLASKRAGRISAVSSCLAAAFSIAVSKQTDLSNIHSFKLSCSSIFYCC